MEKTDQNKNAIIPYAIIVVLASVLFFKSCQKQEIKEKIIVQTKEVKGSFQEQIKPKHETVIVNKTSEANDQNPLLQKLLKENEYLKLQFLQTKDSLAKTKIYEEAIKINTFSSDFEDENIKLNINGIVRGEVQAITPNYIIKPQKIELQKPKETAFRILGGGEVGTNKGLEDLYLKGNVGFQNRKGNILTLSYDTQQRFWIGYQFSVFSFK